MKHGTSIATAAFLFLACGLLRATVPSATAVWTGLGPTDWRGNLTPPLNGTDILSLGKSVNQKVTFTNGNSFSTLILRDGEEYLLTSAGAATLGVTGGVIDTGTSSTSFGRLTFDSSLTVALSGTPSFDPGPNTIVVKGQLTGTTSGVTLSSNTGSGAFIFANTSAGSTYTGGTTLHAGVNGGITVAFWNTAPFGTGALTITNDYNVLIAHGTQTLANAITINNDGTTSNTTGTSLEIKTWDAPLTFTGPVTLATATTLYAGATTPPHVTSATSDGVFPMPGPRARYPIIFSGNIGESAAGMSLTVSSASPVIFTSTSNTYTGGTKSNGALIIGTAVSAPAGANNLTANVGGYVGFADLATPFATQVAAHVDLASPGAIGVDTLPGGTQTTLADAINLSNTGTGALNFTNGTLRLGTATSATLTGALTPQGTNYQFGNGGGTLTVATPLGDTAGNGVTVTGRAVTLRNDSNSRTPLKLTLTGANTYTGGTTAGSGFIIFDSASGVVSIPGTGLLTAGGSSTNTGNSYISYTNAFIDMIPFAFLSKFDKTNTWGVIGFDQTTRTGFGTPSIGATDLTGFNNGVYLGTATAANLTGALTPTADGILRFTAGNGGTLTVTTSLTGTGAVVLGSPSSANEAMSNGTVALNGTNTYGGGTTINTNGGLTVLAGSNGAFGTGTVTIAKGNGDTVGLAASAAGLVIPNAIAFQAGDATYSGGTLALTGTNDFTLSGALSGTADLTLIKALTDTPIHITLSGNNSAMGGSVDLQNSTLRLANANALGQAEVYFHDANAIAEVTSGLTSAIFYGVHGDKGQILLPSTGATVLSFDTSLASLEHEFGGTITGPGGGATDASLVVNAPVNPSSTSDEVLYLYGHNTFTGGSSITGQAVLALGASDSAGTGPITINTTDGGLAINKGVVLTNALTFTAGGLGGVGTFQPSAVNGVTGGPLVFGTGLTLFPGIPGNHKIPGILTLSSNVTFAPGGTFEWLLQDAGRVDGFSSLLINGNLNLTATAGTFTMRLHSIDNDGLSGTAAVFNPYANQSWTIVTTSGGSITGFNAADFAFDVTKFEQGTIPASNFSVSLVSTNTLVLNFAAIPEPSTYALMALGLGFVGFCARRRRA